MCEQHLAALAVIDGAALQIAAAGNANDHRTFEGVIRAPPQHRHFVAKLVHGWPDIIEELNLGYRFQPARPHSHCAPDNAGLGDGCVKDAGAAKFALQIVSDFENAAFAFNFVQILFAAAIGYVFAESKEAFVAGHLVMQAGVNQIEHGLGIALRRCLAFGVKRLRCRVYVRRIDIHRRRLFGRCRSLHRHIGGAVDVIVNFLRQALKLRFRDQFFFDQMVGKRAQRVALRFGGALGFRAIQPLVIR